MVPEEVRCTRVTKKGKKTRSQRSGEMEEASDDGSEDLGEERSAGEAAVRESSPVSLVEGEEAASREEAGSARVAVLGLEAPKAKDSGRRRSGTKFYSVKELVSLAKSRKKVPFPSEARAVEMAEANVSASVSPEGTRHVELAPAPEMPGDGAREEAEGEPAEILGQEVEMGIAKKRLEKGKVPLEEVEGVPSRKRRCQPLEGDLPSTKRARFLARAIKHTAKGGPPLIEFKVHESASTRIRRKGMPPSVRKLLFPRDRRFLQRRGFSRVLNQSTFRAFQMFQNHLFFEEELKQTAWEYEQLLREKEEADEEKAYFREEATRWKDSSDAANHRAEEMEKDFDEVSRKMKEEAEGMREALEAAVSSEAGLRALVDEGERQMAELDQIIALTKSANERALEEARESKGRICRLEDEKEKALEEVVRAKAELEVARSLMAEKKRKWKRKKKGLRRDVRKAEERRKKERAELEEKMKLVGSVAGAQTKLEMLEEFKAGKSGEWKLDEDIADCRVVLDSFGDLFSSGDGKAGDEGSQ